MQRWWNSSKRKRQSKPSLQGCRRWSKTLKNRRRLRRPTKPIKMRGEVHRSVYRRRAWRESRAKELKKLRGPIESPLSICRPSIRVGNNSCHLSTLTALRRPDVVSRLLAKTSTQRLRWRTKASSPSTRQAPEEQADRPLCWTLFLDRCLPPSSEFLRISFTN